MICFVINSLGGGGAERSIIQVANDLGSRGLKVCLIAVNREGRDLVQPNIPTFHLNRRQNSGIISFIRTLIEFRKVLKITKAEILVLNCDLPELLGCFVSSRCAIYVVEHANPSWRTRSTLGFIIRKYESIRGVRWIKVSKHLHITFCPSARAKVLENPVPEIYRRNSGNSPESGIERLVFIGRFEEVQKRPKLVLDAAWYLNLPCLFIGTGPNLATLKAHARKKKIKVKFLDYSLDPWNELESGDLLVAPSAYEGDGLVVVEAIILGIPILLSKIVDFERFELPDHHYFSNLEDLVDKISRYRLSASDLIVPREISNQFRESRDVNRVGLDWYNMFLEANHSL